MPALPLHAAEPRTAVLGVMLYPADEDIGARDCWEALVLAPLISKLRIEGEDVETGLCDWVLAHCGLFAIDQKDLRDRWAGGTMIGGLVTVAHWLAKNRPEVAGWENSIEWLEAMMYSIRNLQAEKAICPRLALVGCIFFERPKNSRS